jgi:hypothetical protein
MKSFGVEAARFAATRFCQLDEGVMLGALSSVNSAEAGFSALALVDDEVFPLLLLATETCPLQDDP